MSAMNLSLGALLLVLDFLFGEPPADEPEKTRELRAKRAEVLARSIGLAMYLPTLRNFHERLSANPEAVAAADALLSGELARVDGRHDGFGAALFHFAQALLRCPTSSAATRTTAEAIIAHLIPRLAELRRKYPAEAEAARARRPRLDALAGDLRALSLPDGQTAYDWAEGYIGAGEQLQQLLGQRALHAADDKRELDGPTARELRPQLASLLIRARAALAEELALGTNPLPANADQLVFGYLDHLVESATPGAGAQPSTPSTPTDVVI